MINDQPIAAAKQTAAAPPARLSKGEKLFDGIVYGLMNYVGTFFITVALADMLQTKPWGKKLCEEGKRGLMKMGMKEKIADSAITTSILMPGGSVMLIPVHALEKRRTDIVAWFNQKFGDTTDKQTIAHEVPQQTWGSLIKGRLVAWGTVFLTMVGVETAIGSEKFKAFSEKTGQKFASLFKVPAAQRNETSLPYRYGKLGALDALATAASVTLLYVSSKFFAQRREEHKEYIERHPTASVQVNDREGRDEVAETQQEMPLGSERASPATTVAGEKQVSSVLATAPAQQATLSHA